jgi:Ca2+-binding RTX toxin-like protein
MAWTFAEKTVFSGAVPFSAAEKATILAAMQTAYDGSGTARTMFENWIATGKTIGIENVPGVFQAFVGAGNLQIDLAFLNDLSYVNDKGKPVLHSLLGALVHELGHALTGRLDNTSATDYQGDNVRYVNTIWKELGLDKEISYLAQARSNLHKVGYEYTNGATINAARTGDVNMNTAALGNSKDLLIGGPSANILQSSAGDDFLFGAGGNDDLNGGAGKDTAVYYGSALDYDIRQNLDGSWAVRNARGAKDAGSDTLKNIETVQFDGGKTYELKKNGLTFQTDFALVIDTTGSMGSSIGSVKTQASALIDAVFAGGKNDGRIGVVGFKDTTNGEPSSVILPFTDQDDFAARKSAAISAINGITVGGGGDLPETAYDGLLVALNGSMGQWRPGSGVHRIALFTDAPAKDGALAGQVTTLANSIGATISKKASIASLGGSVDTFNLSFGGGSSTLFNPDDPSASPDFPFVSIDDPITPDPTTTQVQIFTIFTGPTGTDTTALSDIAKANGGDLLSAPTNDELVKKLFEIINAPPVPIISVTANDPNAAEPANPGQFTLTRTGAFDQSLTVNYTISGTATNSADYQTLSGAAIFAAGAGSATINVNVIDDLTNEGNETVILNLADGGTKYQLDSVKSSDTVTIADNDTGKVDPHITGTPLADSLMGGDGNDIIFGLGENDTLKAGLGDDEIYGGDGNDGIFGEDGQDYAEGGAGDDTILGGNGNDELYGQKGNDSIDGGEGDDWVGGDDGNDTLLGGIGEDTLIGGLGSDNLSGGTGIDIFGVSKASGLDNILDFTPGEDQLQVSASDFGGLTIIGSSLAASQFLSGASIDVNSASSAAQRFLYNTTTGALYFDADGLNGIAAVQVASLATKPVISGADFSVVA